MSTSIKITDKGFELLYKDEGIILSEVSFNNRVKKVTKFNNNLQATSNNSNIKETITKSDIQVKQVLVNEEDSSSDTSLLDSLLEFRANKANMMGIEDNMILSNKDLEKIIKNNPRVKYDLNRLKINPNSIRFYGSEIIDIVNRSI
jgi:ribonuclease D